MTALPPQILSLLVFLCVGGGFFLAPKPVWALTFYLGVLPATLHQLWLTRLGGLRNAHVLLTVLLIAWSAATLLWGENPCGGRVPKFWWESFCTLVFFLALLLTLREDHENKRRLGSILIFAGACNAVISITIFIVASPGDGRLSGWAQTGQPILGALVMATCFVCALDRTLNETRLRFYHAGAALLCLLFIILTGSRGPIFTAAVTMLVLALGSPSRGKLAVMAAIALAASTVAVFIPHWLNSDLRTLIDRGTEYRVLIWKFTLHRVAERPWFGHGLAANLDMPADPGIAQPEIMFPHSLYLSALYYSGIIGLGLLLAVIGAMTWGILRVPDRRGKLFLLALWAVPLCGGLTDIGQVTHGPGEIWFILWVPLAIIVAGTGNGAEPLQDSARPRPRDNLEII